MTLLLFYLALAIGVSFLCSILEAVLLSLTPSFVVAMREDGGNPAGRILENLKQDLDRPLAAILTLNTAAHTIGAAGVGAQAHAVFEHLPTTVISAVLTILILVFSEIIPKTIGGFFWKALAVPSAYVIQFLTVAFLPFVLLSQGISRFITPKTREPAVSREEIMAMTDMGQEQGVLDEADANTIQSVMRFRSLKVRDVLTPRSVVQSLKSGMTLHEAKAVISGFTFSRYPVIDKSDRIDGYVLQADLLTKAGDGDPDQPIDELVRPVSVVLDNLPLKQAMALFLRKREHLAIVIDEFGSFKGVVTLEDVVEALIGLEIMDEVDTVENMQALARETYHSRSADPEQTVSENRGPDSVDQQPDKPEPPTPHKPHS